MNAKIYSNIGKLPKKIDIDEIYKGIVSGSTTALAKGVTLIESSSPRYCSQAQKLLQMLLPRSGDSIRVGITGPPGVGKSSLIEALGTHLIERGHKVAALAIDPSSSISRGSILGDKTRMENLSRSENAFVRPSPSGGALGGVARKTRETIFLCEAAGYDVVLIETVGVGQSETKVRWMTDFFLLMLPPGGGDELQGIKKGSVEICDAILINKADGANEQNALITKNSYDKALQLFMPFTEGWRIKTLIASAIENRGVVELWETVEKFAETTKASGVFEARRRGQNTDRFRSNIEDGLLSAFFGDDKIKKLIPELEKMVREGRTSPTQAAEKALETFFKNISRKKE